MKPIWIDFIQSASPPLRRLRIGVLVCGVLALGTSLMQVQKIGKEKSALAWQQQNLTRLESRKLPILHAPAETGASQDTTKRANEVLRQLNQPWDQLFRAIEQAMGHSVSILSIAPDPHKSTITLKALAPNMDVAIDFIKRLQATKLLTGVHLVNQETILENKKLPLQITISAGLRGPK